MSPRVCAVHRRRHLLLKVPVNLVNGRSAQLRSADKVGSSGSNTSKHQVLPKLPETSGNLADPDRAGMCQDSFRVVSDVKLPSFARHFDASIPRAEREHMTGELCFLFMAYGRIHSVDSLTGWFRTGQTKRWFGGSGSVLENLLSNVAAWVRVSDVHALLALLGIPIPAALREKT